jgi:hypothetical protein
MLPFGKALGAPDTRCQALCKTMNTYHIFIILSIVYSLALSVRMMCRWVFVMRPKAWTFAGWLIALARYLIILLFYPDHIRRRRRNDPFCGSARRRNAAGNLPVLARRAAHQNPGQCDP